MDRACVLGSPFSFLTEHVFLNWPHLFHRNDIGDSLCLLARQFMSRCMRHDGQRQTFKPKDGERRWLQLAWIIHPSLGSSPGRCCWAKSQGPAFQLWGKDRKRRWTSKHSAVVCQLCQRMQKGYFAYVPTKPNFKGIDELFFRLASEEGGGSIRQPWCRRKLRLRKAIRIQKRLFST